MGDAPLPFWPRLLRAEKAAAYLDVSKAHFLTAIAPEIAEVRLSSHVVGWLREDLDAWLDARAGRSATSAANNPWDAPPDARRASPSRS